MPERYDEILEQCIGRVLSGATVEACVAPYPDVSADLREDLDAFTQAFDEFDQKPSWDAIIRSRERLAAELRMLEMEDAENAQGPSWWTRLWGRASSGWQGLSVGQRVTGAATAAFVFGLLTGVMLIAVSASAVPGDTLYATKRAVEEARLALAFTDDSKADLQLTYAERRALEASRLIKEGDFELAAETVQQIDTHLTLGTTLAVSDENAAREFAAVLTADASETLTQLDAAVAATPPEQRARAAETASQASSSYADASERVAAPSPVLATGTMQFWAADPPPPGVAAAIVRIKRIEAYLAAGADSRWQVVIDGERSFDLVDVAQDPELLGAASLAAGTYTRFRFELGHATIVAAGITHQIEPAFDRIELHRPFSLNESGLTPVYFDFDGDLSVQANQAGGFTFTPVVAARPSFTPSFLQPVATPTPSPTQTPTLTPTPTETPVPTATPTPPFTPTPVRVSTLGVVASIGEGHILLASGHDVLTTPQTIVTPGLAIGSIVTITGVINSEGVLVAERVTLALTPATPTPTPTPSVTTSPTPSPTPTVLELEGLLLPEDDDTYTIGDQTVRIIDETEIVGNLVAYASVEVTGEVQTDGTVVADVVTVVAPPEAVQVRGPVLTLNDQVLVVAGQEVTITPDTAIQGDLAPGVLVDVMAVRSGDDSVLATSVEVLSLLPTPGPTPTATPVPGTPSPSQTPSPGASPTPTATPPGPSQAVTPSPSTFVVEGNVTSLVLGLLMLEGMEVRITSETVISGNLGLLAGPVRVEGYFDEDGVGIATSVTVL